MCWCFLHFPCCKEGIKLRGARFFYLSLCNGGLFKNPFSARGACKREIKMAATEPQCGQLLCIVELTCAAVTGPSSLKKSKWYRVWFQGMLIGHKSTDLNGKLKTEGDNRINLLLAVNAPCSNPFAAVGCTVVSSSNIGVKYAGTM
ncbi:hypothetical protein FKM82_005161 [Ascaphus truei]